jgi:hypothetical protein
VASGHRSYLHHRVGIDIPLDEEHASGADRRQVGSTASICLGASSLATTA